MKLKLSIIALALFAAASFSSCKKDYSCECTTTGGSQDTSATITINESKKKATDACEAMSSEVGDLKTTCVIK